MFKAIDYKFPAIIPEYVYSLQACNRVCSKVFFSMSAVIIDYRVDVCRITKVAHIEHL